MPEKRDTQMNANVKLKLAQWGRWLLVLIMAGSILISCMGSRQSSTAFADMQAGVVPCVQKNITNGLLKEADAQMIRRLYGLDGSQFDGILLYYPTSNMGAEELLLVKTKEPGQMAQVEQAIAARNAQQLSNFDGYGADQTAMLENAVTVIRGNYALYAVGAGAEGAEKVFQDLY